MASVERLPDTHKGTPWRARVRLPGGKVQTRTFYSEKAARKWAATVEGDKARGVLPANLTAGRITLREWSAEWLETRDLRDSTRCYYRTLLDLWLLPELGEVSLDKLTPERVRRWHSLSKRRAVAKGRGAGQIPKAYRLLHTLMETATEEELLARNPCRIRGAGRDTQRERPLLEPEDVWTLAERMGEVAPHLRAFVLLAAFGGLRFGELRGLERRDVNLLAGTVRIERQLDSRDRLGPPKTDAGTRSVSLPSFLTEELRAHLDTYTPNEPGARVFRGDKGAPLSTSTAYKWWHRVREDCGFPWAHVHDLRHTGGTTYASLGASIREVQSFGGWSTPAAALRYMHTAERRKAELADRLGVAAEAARDGERTNVVDLDRARNAREAVGGGVVPGSSGGEHPAVPGRSSGAGDENRTRTVSLGS